MTIIAISFLIASSCSDNSTWEDVVETDLSHLKKGRPSTSSIEKRSAASEKASQREEDRTLADIAAIANKTMGSIFFTIANGAREVFARLNRDSESKINLQNTKKIIDPLKFHYSTKEYPYKECMEYDTLAWADAYHSISINRYRQLNSIQYVCCE